jgi:hypothetical protein
MGREIPHARAKYYEKKKDDVIELIRAIKQMISRVKKVGPGRSCSSRKKWRRV